MTYSIEATAAEHVIGAVDAVLSHNPTANEQNVADFCQLRIEPARRALRMAEQLALVQNNGGLYSCINPISRALIGATGSYRSAVFRLLLETYEPFLFFCGRIYLGEDPSAAASKVKSVFGLAEHHDDVRDTLISLGTYCSAIESQGAGLYRVPSNDRRTPAHLASVGFLLRTLDTEHAAVASALGPVAYAYLHSAQALDELILAHNLLSGSQDPRAVIVHAGNAVESFLVKLAQDRNVNLSGANGINQKTQRLSANRGLTAKHQAMLGFLGHLRNAADHGVDVELNAQWAITERVAGQYVAVAISAFASILEANSSRYVL
ncbi:MAG TPA: hypothetical protein VEY88_04325 [Archangium sp.]|nr:hypothetical protein [Archangium sp.]